MKNKKSTERIKVQAPYVRNRFLLAQKIKDIDSMRGNEF